MNLLRLSPVLKKQIARSFLIFVALTFNSGVVLKIPFLLLSDVSVKMRHA